MRPANVQCPGVGGYQSGGPFGFSMVELVVVIVILGIIAIVAIPSFTARNSFDSRGFFDQATATVRFAQKLAIARRRSANPIVVTVTATTISVCCNNADGTGGAVIDPTTGAALSITAPAGVTLSPTTISFDGLGRTSPAQTITFTSTIAGDPARSIVVENETGYVHTGP